MKPAPASKTRSVTPKPAKKIADTELNSGSPPDPVLKILYNASTISGHEIAERINLPFVDIVNQILGFCTDGAQPCPLPK